MVLSEGTELRLSAVRSLFFYRARMHTASCTSSFQGKIILCTLKGFQHSSVIVDLSYVLICRCNFFSEFMTREKILIEIINVLDSELNQTQIFDILFCYVMCKMLLCIIFKICQGWKSCNLKMIQCKLVKCKGGNKEQSRPQGKT